MKRFEKLLLPVLLLCTSCDNITISRSEPQIAFASQIPDGSFCSRPAETASGQLKVVFILDMSLSNLGAFKQDGTKTKFERANATDPTGIRFQKAQEFIEKCGSQNSKNTFKVVGFSGASLKANPAVSGCSAGFENRDQAISSIKSLKQLQQYNSDNIEYTDFKASMQTTSYQDGLDCAKNIVVDDMNVNSVEAKNSNYQIFFVTDGEATDNCPENLAFSEFRDEYGTCCPGGSIRAGGSCCAPGVIASSIGTIWGVTQSYCCRVGDRRNEENKCEVDAEYQDKLSRPQNPRYEALIKDMMFKGLQKAGTIKLQTLFYGDQTGQPQAVKILDQMAEWGGSEKTIAIDNVEQADFCQYANSPVKTEYQTSEFNIINLTAIMKNQFLKPDSDMDGIIDSDDSNPTNARSNSAGLLDGICRSVNGNMNCKKPVSCLATRRSPLRLNECDLATLSLAESDGLDFDQDRIPDYVEAIRSTLPNLNDSFNNLDGDNLSNIQEIHVGRQVDSPDDTAVAKILQNWSISRMPNDDLCPSNQKQYQIKLNQIATVPTEAFTDPEDAIESSLLKYSHGKNENVILIYYFSEPLNNKSMPTEMFATTVKVPYGATDLSKIYVNPKSFVRLGSVDGKPKW